ncbi:MAG: hypothetical protein ABH829_00420 [archaeon]
MKPFLEAYSKTDARDGKKVQIIGRIEKANGGFSLKAEKSSKPLIFAQKPQKLENMELVRVFGTAAAGGIKVDFVQDMAGLDLDKYLKVKALEELSKNEI